jgi:hypothetical protein
MKVATLMTIKIKIKSLDGCNIQIMDENTSKWIKMKMKRKMKTLTNSYWHSTCSLCLKNEKKFEKLYGKFGLDFPCLIIPNLSSLMNLPKGLSLGG